MDINILYNHKSTVPNQALVSEIPQKYRSLFLGQVVTPKQVSLGLDSLALQTHELLDGREGQVLSVPVGAQYMTLELLKNKSFPGYALTLDEIGYQRFKGQVGIGSGSQSTQVVLPEQVNYDQPIFVVDDLLHEGITAKDIGYALREAGAQEVHFLTVAVKNYLVAKVLVQEKVYNSITAVTELPEEGEHSWHGGCGLDVVGNWGRTLNAIWALHIDNVKNWDKK